MSDRSGANRRSTRLGHIRRSAGGSRSAAPHPSVLFLDASHIYRQIGRTRRDFTPEQIEVQGWSLNPCRYVGFKEQDDDGFDFKVNTDPAQFPSVSIEGSDESAVVTIRAEQSPIKPVWAFGRPLKRVGRTNQPRSVFSTSRLLTGMC